MLHEHICYFIFRVKKKKEKWRKDRVSMNGSTDTYYISKYYIVYDDLEKEKNINIIKFMMWE